MVGMSGSCGERVAVLMPSALVALGVQSNLWLTGFQTSEQWAQDSLAIWLSDTINMLALTAPLLAYGTPLLRARGWISEPLTDSAPTLSISRSPACPCCSTTPSASESKEASAADTDAPSRAQTEKIPSGRRLLMRTTQRRPSEGHHSQQQ